jgi:hypothetical protein
VVDIEGAWGCLEVKFHQICIGLVVLDEEDMDAVTEGTLAGIVQRSSSTSTAVYRNRGEFAHSHTM